MPCRSGVQGPVEFEGTAVQVDLGARRYGIISRMALVVFLLRGVNVGGHRTFSPSVLANQLSDTAS